MKNGTACGQGEGGRPEKLLSGAAVAARLQLLPALPAGISGLLASLDDEDVDTGRIAAQIAGDQALAARVLRIANSSFYGLRTAVGTVADAVVVLGFRSVRNLALAVAMNGAFRAEQCPGFDAAGYLRHGIGAGLAARALAPPLGLNADLAFTAGLLHDIGTLVLAANFSSEYGAALAFRKRQGCFLRDAEREVLGLDHAEVGGLLAAAWNFPAALGQAVADHHDPERTAPGSFARLVHVADAMAHTLGMSPCCNEVAIVAEEAAREHLGLDRESYLRLLPAIEKDFEHTCRALAA